MGAKCGATSGRKCTRGPRWTSLRRRQMDLALGASHFAIVAWCRAFTSSSSSSVAQFKMLIERALPPQINIDGPCQSIIYFFNGTFIGRALIYVTRCWPVIWHGVAGVAAVHNRPTSTDRKCSSKRLVPRAATYSASATN